MKKIAVILFSLFLAQGVSAQNITFTVPEIPGEIEKSEYANYTLPAMDCIEWLKTHSPNDPHRKRRQQDRRSVQRNAPGGYREVQRSRHDEVVRHHRKTDRKRQRRDPGREREAGHRDQ